MKSIRLVTLVLLIIAVATSAGSAFAAPSKKKLTTVIVPLNSWTAIAAKKGWLAEEFGKLGLKSAVIDQGTSAVAGQEAALLARGEVHFASRMSYPALIHKTNGLDAVIIWQSGKSDIYRTPLVTLKESPIQTIADLKGKTYGGSRVGCGWSSPYEALRKAGLPLDTATKKGEVRFLNQGSSIATTSALLGGQIDFTATHIALNGWANLVTQGVIKVVGRSVEDGVYVNAAGRPAIFALREFAEAHPQVIQAFLRLRERTADWIRENPDESASIIARENRVPRYVAKFQITDASTFDFMPAETSWDAAVASIKAFQQWYKDNDDDILAKQSLTDAQIEAFVDRRFFKGGQYSGYEL